MSRGENSEANKKLLSQQDSVPESSEQDERLIETQPETGSEAYGGNERIDIFETVDISNIRFDPHLHTSSSDGDILHNITWMSKTLGVPVGVADHVRQVKDDVVYYRNDDQAYRNTDPAGSEEIWVADNLEILGDVVEDHRNDSRGEKWDLEGTLEALEAFAEEEGLDSEDIRQEAIKLLDTVGIDQKNPVMSAEQDYEEWNEEVIEEAMHEEDLDYWVLSTHYIGTDDWDRPRYFRHSDFEDLSEEELQNAADNYFDRYRNMIRFGTQKEREIGKSVIHTHMDGPLRNDDLRLYMTEEQIDKTLDLAEEHDAVIEINGRIIRKLRSKYTSEDNFHAPEDAEWFARKVLDRAEEGNLDFTIASDAHTSWEMFEQYAILDDVLDDYDVEPLGYGQLIERGLEKQSGYTREKKENGLEPILEQI